MIKKNLILNSAIEKKNKKLFNGTFLIDNFHHYWANGELLNNSITTIVDLKREQIMEEEKLNPYADFGTAVHKAIENWCYDKKENVVEVTIKEKKRTLVFNNEKQEILYKNLDKFFQGSEIIMSECLIINKRRKAPGTIDMTIRKNGKTILIDFKTSKKIMLNHFMQINIYKRILWNDYKKFINEMYVIQVDKETFKLKATKITDVSDTIWEMIPKKQLERTFIKDDLVELFK